MGPLRAIQIQFNWIEYSTWRQDDVTDIHFKVFSIATISQSRVRRLTGHIVAPLFPEGSSKPWNSTAVNTSTPRTKATFSRMSCSWRIPAETRDVTASYKQMIIYIIMINILIITTIIYMIISIITMIIIIIWITFIIHYYDTYYHKNNMMVFILF